MKKLFLIFVPVIFVLLIAVSSLFSGDNILKNEPEKEKPSSTEKKNETKKEKIELSGQSITCKTCHESEFPTKSDPGLRGCIRDLMISQISTTDEGPEVVLINQMSENYTGVVFSHKIHSQMSSMTTGCSDCHHYNTTGKILKCNDCHNNERYRENISVPDLKAAFHRQCMMCHKEWSHENGCNNQCHFTKSSGKEPPNAKTLSGKVHPERKEPTKMIWETKYGKGKIVTFFHNEHNRLFRIDCKTCHINDKCIKCHDKSGKSLDYSKSNPINKSFEEHHMPCLNCHKDNSCDKCHREKEMSPFNHAKSTGWVLKQYHSRLACARCHGNSTPLKRPDKNCSSCHTDFVQGKFDHSKTGLTLSENHKDMECISCHINNDFAKNPDCKTCHDDKSFPAQLPGKRK